MDKIDDIIMFLEPYVHDDGALEEGGDIEDTEQKRVCNFVNLVQDLCSYHCHLVKDHCYQNNSRSNHINMIPRNLAKAKDDSKGKGTHEAMQDELETADGNKSSQMKKNCQKIL